MLTKANAEAVGSSSSSAGDASFLEGGDEAI